MANMFLKENWEEAEENLQDAVDRFNAEEAGKSINQTSVVAKLAIVAQRQKAVRQMNWIINLRPDIRMEDL